MRIYLNTCYFEQALQFDPTLRSEIEYDLKQFERAKKDKLTAAITAFSAKKAGGTRTAPGTMQQSARKPLSPFLDLQQIPSRSIVKPSLRKSLGGEASRGRTPYDALKSPGNILLFAHLLNFQYFAAV